MPLLALGIILCVGLLIYTVIKNKKDISAAGDALVDKLFSLFEKLINELNKSSTSFTVEDDDKAEDEEEKIFYFPGTEETDNNDKSTED